MIRTYTYAEFGPGDGDDLQEHTTIRVDWRNHKLAWCTQNLKHDRHDEGVCRELLRYRLKFCPATFPTIKRDGPFQEGTQEEAIHLYKIYKVIVKMDLAPQGLRDRWKVQKERRIVNKINDLRHQALELEYELKRSVPPVEWDLTWTMEMLLDVVTIPERMELIKINDYLDLLVLTYLQDFPTALRHRIKDFHNDRAMQEAMHELNAKQAAQQKKAAKISS